MSNNEVFHSIARIIGRLLKVLMCKHLIDHTDALYIVGYNHNYDKE